MPGRPPSPGKIDQFTAEEMDLIRNGLAPFIENEAQWALLWPLLLKEANKSRNPDRSARIEHLLRFFDPEIITGIRAVRGTLKILIGCPCGRCGENHQVPFKRTLGKLDLPQQHLCRYTSEGRPGISLNRVRHRGEH